MSQTSITRRVLRRVEVNRDLDTDVDFFVQKDTRPLPPSRRTYGPWDFVGLWMVTGSFNVGGWTTGSSLISLGLNVPQAIGTVIVAQVFVALSCIAGGAAGAKWHISFPFWMKQVWGTWGFLFPMIIRVFLSLVYSATNTWYGAQCLRTFITALWPSFLNLDTPLADGTMYVYDFVAFLLFLLLCLPLMWRSPENYRIPFLVASVTVATTVFVLLIWCTVRAGGGGALLTNTSAVSGVAQATGAKLGWAFTAAVTANIGGVATHMFSQSDYTRYARKPGDQILSQLIIVPLGTMINAVIGIVCTSCAAQLYPEATSLLWQPYAFLNAVLKYENNSGARAGVAFASMAFVFSQFGIVVASNAVVAGIDLAALLPRWFTVRRGGYVTMAFVFILQPWQLLNSASNFLTVVGSFSVFLSPFMGIMFSDYFLLRKRTMKLTDLYEQSSKSIYWYSNGWNWRAAVSWVAAVWFLMPGLVQRGIDSGAVWPGWTRLYELAWFLGILVSAFVYMTLEHFWPISNKTVVDDADYFGTFTELEIVEGFEREGAGTSLEAEDEKVAKQDVLEV